MREFDGHRVANGEKEKMFGSPLTKHQDLRYEDVETTEDVEAPSSVGGLASKSATTAWLYMLSMANFGIQSVWALAVCTITYGA